MSVPADNPIHDAARANAKGRRSVDVRGAPSADRSVLLPVAETDLVVSRPGLWDEDLD
jgi:hypothetical protein